MSRMKDEEPLLPPWVAAAGLRLAPLIVLIGAYYVLNTVLRVPARIVIPALTVLVIAVVVYFGGRLYKPFYVDRDGRCRARSAKERASCRHFIRGARLGGGCGRLREDGRCRYVR